jgi:hypothetical protein
VVDRLRVLRSTAKAGDVTATDGNRNAIEGRAAIAEE